MLYRKHYVGGVPNSKVETASPRVRNLLRDFQRPLRRLNGEVKVWEAKPLEAQTVSFHFCRAPVKRPASTIDTFLLLTLGKYAMLLAIYHSSLLGRLAIQRQRFICADSSAPTAPTLDSPELIDVVAVIGEKRADRFDVCGAPASWISKSAHSLSASSAALAVSAISMMRALLSASAAS